MATSFPVNIRHSKKLTFLGKKSLFRPTVRNKDLGAAMEAITHRCPTGDSQSHYRYFDARVYHGFTLH
jgi:hypothetical protein